MPKKHIELDKEDPYHDRTGPKGNRLFLNHHEREIIQKEMDYKKVIEQLTTTEKSIPDILDELGLERRPLTTAVTRNAYPPLRQAFIDVAIQLFLKFDEGITRADIEQHLGMSKDQLRKLTDSEDFAEEYNRYFLELRSHPVIRAVQAKIVEDLLPKSFTVLDQLLSDKKAPASVRLKAALEVIDKSGVKPIDPETSNRRELADFLGKNTTNIENINIAVEVPKEYQEYQEQLDAQQGYSDPDPSDTEDIVDADWTDQAQDEALPPHSADNI